MMLNQASVKQAQEQLVSGLRGAVDKLPMEFERIEQFLVAAIKKAPIEQQLKAQFDAALRPMSRGNFGQPILEELRRIELAWKELGNTAMQQIAGQAAAIAKVGNLAGRVDVHPSWEQSRVASVQQMGYNAWRHSILDRHAMETGSIDSLGRPVAMNMTALGASTVPTSAMDMRALSALSYRAPGSLSLFNAGISATPKSSMDMAKLSSHHAVEDALLTQQASDSADAYRASVAAKYNALHGTTDNATADSRRRRANEQDVQRQIDLQQQSPLGKFTSGNWAHSVGTNPMDMAALAALSHKDPTSLDLFRKGISASPKSAMDMALLATASARNANGAFLGSRDDLIAQRDSMISEYHESARLDPKGKWLNKDNIHRYRFAAQNIGFGIDDAIQSYHYGGIGASIRAASNNVTAIAGMTISNPAIAAATVVGLSVATAALPSVIKSLKLDNNALEAQSFRRYQRDASILGTAERGGDLLAKFQEKADAYYSLSDEVTADHGRRAEALSTLKSLGVGRTRGAKDEGSIFGRMSISGYNSEAGALSYQNIIGTIVGGAAGAKYNAALKYLNDDHTGESDRAAKLKEGLEDIEKIRKNTNFRQIEASAERSRSLNAGLYHASTLGEYEASLRGHTASEIGALPNTPDIRIRRAGLELQLEQRLGQRGANALDVAANNRERSGYMRDSLYSLSGTTDPISSGMQARAGQADQIADRLARRLLTPEAARQLSVANEMNYQRNLSTGLRDFIQTSFGGPDAFQQLTNQHRDRQTSLIQGMLLNPGQAPLLNGLMGQNDAGFKRQRGDLMTAMQNQFKITTPIGQIADTFAAQAKKYEEMFAANPNITAEERDRLTTNLEKSYAVAMKDANKPSGSERFTSDAMEVGSHADRELQSRMLSNFVISPDDADYKKQSLKDFEEMVKSLSAIQEKLETARLKL